MNEIPLDSINNPELKLNGFKEKLPLLLRAHTTSNLKLPIQGSNVDSLLDKLYRSRLFSEVVRHEKLSDYERYILLDLSAKKVFDSHGLSNVIRALYMYILFLPLNTLLIIGAITGDIDYTGYFFPTSQFIYDYKDEYICIFQRWDGETREFSAKASAQLKLDVLAIGSGGVRELDSKVKNLIMDSIIEQMKCNSNFFYQNFNIEPISPIAPITIIIN
tara:strand:+ start:376 stop:1029 length:654 start_codon:yes stop_codon:yes gene_type:complete